MCKIQLISKSGGQGVSIATIKMLEKFFLSSSLIFAFLLGSVGIFQSQDFKYYKKYFWLCNETVEHSHQEVLLFLCRNIHCISLTQSDRRYNIKIIKLDSMCQ